MLARICSATLHGIDGVPVTVEVDFRFGMPTFNIVGLPDTGIRESRERVITAIKNSQFSLPAHRITVNLAPAHLKKGGAAFDFAIAIGILVAADIIPEFPFDKAAFLGELGLNGDLQPARGILPCVLGLKKKGIQSVLVPKPNAREAALVDGIDIIPIQSLEEAFEYLIEKISIAPFCLDRQKLLPSRQGGTLDFSDVKGQLFTKRALEIAAAGGHNVLLIGPPGSGKTLLARCVPTILPPMSFEESLEATKIHSVAGVLKNNNTLLHTRPFRSPHHQISDSALIGGGTNPKPGEVSLAHRGVLFLDEFPEFSRHVLEALRQPLEDRSVTVARVANTVKYPSDFVLIAAANPCPCGYLGSQVRTCVCTPVATQKYRAKISGPLMDRIDLHVSVPSLKPNEITDSPKGGETSDQIRTRVVKARKIQTVRLRSENLFENAQMNVRQIRRFCAIDPEGKNLLQEALKKLGLSARSYDRLLRIARTIADLDQSEEIKPVHLAEAISYRILDRSQETS